MVGPGRVAHDHLIALVQNGRECQAQTIHAAVGDDDFCGRIVVLSVDLFHLLRDSLFQL